MGMTIDKAIKLMIRGSKYDYDGTPEEFCEAYDMSIEIMRKYQKITEIVTNNGLEWGNTSVRANALLEVKKVVEDGNDD